MKWAFGFLLWSLTTAGNILLLFDIVSVKLLSNKWLKFSIRFRYIFSLGLK